MYISIKIRTSRMESHKFIWTPRIIHRESEIEITRNKTIQISLFTCGVNQYDCEAGFGILATVKLVPLLAGILPRYINAKYVVVLHNTTLIHVPMSFCQNTRKGQQLLLSCIWVLTVYGLGVKLGFKNPRQWKNV